MEFFLICCIAFMVLLNLSLFYFVGTYIVRMNDRFSQIMNDLINVLGEQNTVIPNTNENSSKSWDQKYEEELDAFAARMRADAGLLDIESSTSYNAPPAPNRRNSEGLTIQNR